MPTKKTKTKWFWKRTYHRALGWDTMLPTSSCGTRMSPRAFGHTGYAGTSLWIDPQSDVYVARGICGDQTTPTDLVAYLRGLQAVSPPAPGH